MGTVARLAAIAVALTVPACFTSLDGYLTVADGSAPDAEGGAAETGSASDTGATPTTDTGTSSDTGSRSDTGTGSDTGAGSDTGGGADTGAGTDAGLDAGAPDTGIDTGAPDTGTDTGTDAGIDAGVDAGIDAGVDAGTDSGSDAGVVGFCAGAGTHTVCRDFDTPATNDYSDDIINSGTVTLDSTHYVSTGFALKGHAAASPAGDRLGAGYVSIDPTTTSVHVEADVYACDPNPSNQGSALFLSLEFQGMNGDFGSVSLGIETGDTSLESFVGVDLPSDYQDYKAGAALSTTSFSHVSMSVVFGSGTGGSVKVEVDGVTRLEVAGVPTDLSGTVITQRVVEAGVYVEDTGAACDAWIDNLVVDAQ